jgi:hypothetical protein
MFLTPGYQSCEDRHERLADFSQGIFYTGRNLGINLAMDEMALLKVLQGLR